MKKVFIPFIIFIILTLLSFSDSVVQNSDSGNATLVKTPVSAKKVVTSSQSATLPLTIYFADNVYTLSNYQKNVLNTFAKGYLSQKVKKTLYVTGYADNSDTLDKEYVMSKKRAIAVYSYLKSCHIPTYYMQLYYLGSSVSASPNSTPSGRAMNRRAVISYSKPYTPIKTTTLQPNNSYNFINIK